MARQYMYAKEGKGYITQYAKEGKGYITLFAARVSRPTPSLCPSLHSTTDTASLHKVHFVQHAHGKHYQMLFIVGRRVTRKSTWDGKKL